MIIFKNLTWQVRSDKTNEDWVGTAKYVVDDASQLAEKIIKTAHWEPVEDSDGHLIDITEVSMPIDRRTAILARLVAIDDLEARPLAAVTLALINKTTPLPADVDILASLEDEKVLLRKELVTII